MLSASFPTIVRKLDSFSLDFLMLVMYIALTKLLGQRSGTGWVGRNIRTGKQKHKAFLSLMQSLLAVISLLEEKVLPLLLY